MEGEGGIVVVLTTRIGVEEDDSRGFGGGLDVDTVLGGLGSLRGLKTGRISLGRRR